MPPKRVARPVDPSILSTDSYGQPPAQVYDQQQQPAYFDPSNPHQGQQPAYGGQPAYQQQQQQQHPQAYIQQQQQQYHQQDQQYQQGYPAQAYPANPIAQPPHSTGRPARGGAGGRPQLDPSLVPSPISLLAHAQQYNDSQNAGSWSSALEGGPPGAQVDFRAVDEGASTPTFIRSSLTAVPTTADLLRSSQLPFGIHVTPFAEPLFGEAPIPVIDPGEEGPERCRNCKGYLSSLCHWEGGGRWRCNLCGTTNTSMSGVSTSGYQTTFTDPASRLEIQLGSVDYIVPKAYNFPLPRHAPFSSSAVAVPLDASQSTATRPNAKADAAAKEDEDMAQRLTSLALGPTQAPTFREPRPLKHLFVLDVSWNATASGFLEAWCAAVRGALFEASDDGLSVTSRLGPGEEVAFVGVEGAEIHFWDLGDSEGPRMKTVADLEEPFSPLPPGGLFVDVEKRASQVLSLLALLPSLHASSQAPSHAIGSALSAALSVMAASSGGVLHVFALTPPALGLGALPKPRDEAAMQKTDKEKTLFGVREGREGAWWRTLGEECVEWGIGVNLWVAPSGYADVATMGIISELTGGETFYLPRFDPVRDAARLQSSLRKVLHQPSVWNATLRIRCSTGLRVARHVGSFFERSPTDVDLPAVPPTASLLALLAHSGSPLTEREPASIQVAILHTTRTGERRVRVLNLRLGVTSLIGNVFRYADPDAVVGILTKEGMGRMESKTLPEVRDDLQRRAVKILTSYRRNCALGAPLGQLVLPEGFTLLPLFLLALFKSKPLKPSPVTSDVRVQHRRLVQASSPRSLMTYLYPRLFAVHRMGEDVGQPIEGAEGRIVLGEGMRLGYEWMESDGAYLLINGEAAVLWLGASISPKLLEDLWAVDDLEAVDPRMSTLPRLPTPISKQLRSLLEHFATQAGHELPLTIARQNLDGSELEFANLLVEDKNNGEMAYGDYLQRLHQAVKKELEGAPSGDGEKGGFMGWFAASS